MSKILEQFDKKRIRLTKELRRAVMSGDNYRQLRNALEILDDLEAIYQMRLRENIDAVATFNEMGGVYTRLEDGRYEFKIRDTSLTLTPDEHNNIRQTAILYDPSRDRERMDAILGMIVAIQQRTDNEGMIEEIGEFRERVQKQATIKGNDELRRLIRGDTGLTILAISGMDEAEDEEDRW
jgi:hypothetical protein